MKYIFRGNIIFEYNPEDKYDKVKLVSNEDIGINWDFCSLINEDYKLLGEFFSTVYKHTQGEDVELKDIIVN